MTNVYLIRHGDYIEDKVEGAYQDMGLSPAGVQQVERLRDRLVKTGEIQADVLLSSTLRRAHESATILAPALNASTILDEDLIEWRSDDGRMEPEEFDALWRQVPDRQRPFFRFMPGYETSLEFSLRTQQTLNHIIQEYEGKNIVIITHGGIIQASFVYFFNMSSTPMPAIAVDNASITQWTPSTLTSRWILKRFNDAYHG